MQLGKTAQILCRLFLIKPVKGRGGVGGGSCLTILTHTGAMKQLFATATYIIDPRVSALPSSFEERLWDSFKSNILPTISLLSSNEIAESKTVKELKVFS